jgi:hypothetical protein
MGMTRDNSTFIRHHLLPSLFQPWENETMDKLTVHEAIYIHMQLQKKMKILEDRVERDPWFLAYDIERAAKNKKRQQTWLEQKKLL